MDENNLEKLNNELHVKVKNCVKQKHSCVFQFFRTMIGCPLLTGKFSAKCSPVAQKKCPL